MIRNLREIIAGALFLLMFQLAAGQADFRKSVSQYGITWEFDKPMQTGQFVTGDWLDLRKSSVLLPGPDPYPAIIRQSESTTGATPA